MLIIFYISVLLFIVYELLCSTHHIIYIIADIFVLAVVLFGLMAKIKKGKKV